MTESEARAWYNLIGDFEFCLSRARQALLFGDHGKFASEMVHLRVLTRRSLTLKIEAGTLSNELPI